MGETAENITRGIVEHPVVNMSRGNWNISVFSFPFFFLLPNTYNTYTIHIHTLFKVLKQLLALLTVLHYFFKHIVK